MLKKDSSFPVHVIAWNIEEHLFFDKLSYFQSFCAPNWKKKKNGM